MVEYIDRDKALEEFDAWVESTGVLPRGTSYYAEARGCIECVPAADVEPVRHGRWIFGDTCGHSWMKCSECLVSQSGQTLCFTYCPNCGAKMDGEADT